MMRAPALRMSAGFTLLEVLLAVILLGLLIAGAYGGIRASAHAMRAGEAAIDRTDRLRTAQEFLRRQISQILPLEFGRDDSTGMIHVFDGDARRMRFVAAMPGYLSRGGPYVQTLELAPATDGLQLRFRDTMLNGYATDKSRSDSDVDAVVLLDRIASGRFEYRALDVDGNLGNWSSDWPDPGITPLMVRIDLTMQPGVQMPWPTLDIPLMLNAGAMRPRMPMQIPAATGGQ
ncbi:MAG: prepilin-type N-terminal cleavage/methylation domain-containing protein [Xanthomonadales bacterium PRO7]|jgi:general secretion pathway protein J|nr:prepilin-type N-terminal cleavage/methylation domain-containing protein [Xanthomonadales bacterium PRO7]